MARRAAARLGHDLVPLRALVQERTGAQVLAVGHADVEGLDQAVVQVEGLNIHLLRCFGHGSQPAWEEYVRTGESAFVRIWTGLVAAAGDRTPTRGCKAGVKLGGRELSLGGIDKCEDIVGEIAVQSAGANVFATHDLGLGQRI